MNDGPTPRVTLDTRALYHSVCRDTLSRARARLGQPAYVRPHRSRTPCLEGAILWADTVLTPLDHWCSEHRVGFRADGLRQDGYPIEASLDSMEKTGQLTLALWLNLPEERTAFYVNGRDVGAPRNSGGGEIAYPGLDFTKAHDLYLGAPDPSHHSNRAWYDGLMDEVMIFNRTPGG